MQRRLAAILAADIVGYSALMAADEEGTLSRLKSLNNETLNPVIERHGGQVFKTTGDGLLAEFASVVGAVRAAIDIQAALREVPPETGSTDSLALRIGINVGDVIAADGDVFGDGVNVAARLEPLAQPGGLCVSAAVHQQVRGKLDITFRDKGHQRLKNIAQPVHVYEAVLVQEASPLASGALFDFDDSQSQSEVIAGHCLCGAVRFEIDKPAISTGFCHCRICQKFTGAPVSVWTAFPADAVRFTEGEPKRFNSSPIAERGFCADCGTSLIYRLMKPAPAPFIAVFTAALDNPQDFSPIVHGGIESQMPWLDINDDLPRTRCEESKALRAAWEAAGIADPAKWSNDERGMG